MSWPAIFSRRPKPVPIPEDVRAFDPPEYFSSTERWGLHSANVASQPDDLTLLRNFKSWQAIASKAIADRVGALEMQVVETRRVRAGTEEDEVLDGHPLADAWKRNPVFNEIQLFKLISHWLTHNGSAYLLKVTDRMRMTRELWPMSPAAIEIVGDPDVVISGYIFHGAMSETFYPAEEVVRIWEPDPAAPHLGLGTIGPQAAAFDTDLMAQETLRRHYQDDAIPKVALKASPDSVPPGETQLKAFFQSLRNTHHKRHGRSPGLPATLPPGFDVHEFAGMDLGDQPGIMEQIRDRILMANGVPRSVLGDVVDANRAAAETNQFVFDLHTILPQASMISLAFTRQLAQPEYGESISCRFEEFVSADKVHELEKEKQDLALKVRSINMVHTDRGTDPVDWGDDPVGTLADQPYRPDESMDMSMDDPFAFGEPEEEPPPEDEDEEPRLRHRAGPRADWSPDATWIRFLTIEKKWQPLFARAIVEVFNMQRDATIERAAIYSVDSGAVRGQRDPIDDLFGDVSEWVRLFRRILEPIRRRAFTETGQNVMLELGDTVPFTLTQNARVILQKQGANLVQQTTRTTHRSLKRELAEGVAAGESLSKIERRIRKVFRVRKGHARTIARTEVQKATQQAHVEGFQQSEVVQGKQWNTSRDEAVRDSHKIDGQKRKKDEPFDLPAGDGNAPEQADAPGVGHGGTDLSAGNAINCRCFVTPTFWE